MTLALEADKDVEDPDAERKSEAQRKSLMREAFREQRKLKEFVFKTRSSLEEYARVTGYHELFGFAPPEPERIRTREEIVAEGISAARRALASLG